MRNLAFRFVAAGKHDPLGTFMRRRNFLIGLGATAAAAALPAFGTGERKETRNERLIRTTVEQCSARLRQPNVMQALEGKGSNAFITVLGAIDFPLDSKILEGTKYDPVHLHERTVQLRGRVPLVAPFAKGYFWTEEEGPYGNGIFFDNHRTILTAGHIIDMMGNKPSEFPKELDIGLVHVGTSQKSRPERVVHDNMEISNRDLHGAFVVITGIDPDETADQWTGRKTWVGIAAALSCGVTSDRFFQANRRDVLPLKNSFAVVLPPGEARLRSRKLVYNGPHIKPSTRAAGMSGSPMYAWINDGWVFAGVFWCTNTATKPNGIVDVGFVHGISDVRRGVGTARTVSVE